MMFNKDASSIDKDQLRHASLRSRVSAIGAALKPKRHAQFPAAIAPSEFQSECSTLVDFAVEDVLVKEDDQLHFETEDYMLDAENSAWANGKYSKKQKRGRVSQHVLIALPEQTEALGIENSAWGTGKTNDSPSKTRIRIFSPNRSAQATSGVEPEYLDPEDRAWM
ncbi:hypothetical protein L226DRAFT_528913 [Lentinus tigrinus ALCF2SS1-7]|uniref:Uncharacterized protein n=1 Tax=Lentinus tigrinus ALCF2SS1-6 TaxID=1328759 RepID=A0A5C2SLT8_9APHY|nr:hypothetical protein L227DRAFT_266233 [Lentinus tigrinus ALCF2SS1-6]RPD82786.1 hypothetical protein L226DRAFT_528913 [Lentinus tigrinus ALCF2SS1-7]